jgi:hypothetical protein
MEGAFSTLTSYLITLESRIVALEAEISTLRSTCAGGVPPPSPLVVVPESAAEPAPSTEPAIAESSAAPTVATSEPAVAESSAAPTVATSEPAVAESSAAPTVATSENEVLFNLDKFGPDTIQNELWQQFRAASDAEKVSVVYFEGDSPHNVIVYANESTQPVYRNAAAGEVRVIQAIAGTHILTLQPGESGKTCFTDGVWGPC